MAKLTITRMELLARKEQLVLARQGMELLKQKRAALLEELLQVVDRVLASSDALTTTAAAARRALARAEAYAGATAVASAAMAASGSLALDVRVQHVMGIRVTAIEQKRVARPVLGRGYAPVGMSILIDEAAEAFEAEVNSLIELAESELRLKRLAAELQRTSRRTNALEHVVIPRLVRECRQIQMALDERERTDHFRLKRVKRILAEHRKKDG